MQTEHRFSWQSLGAVHQVFAFSRGEMVARLYLFAPEWANIYDFMLA